MAQVSSSHPSLLNLGGLRPFGLFVSGSMGIWGVCPACKDFERQRQAIYTSRAPGLVRLPQANLLEIRMKPSILGTAKSTTKRARNRLYHAAKISEYQFKRVLWSFVREEPAAKAARHIRLSANSISTLYGKLRVYFYEAGLFTDIYEGRDPGEGSRLAGNEFERRLIDFHFARVGAKRGLDEKRGGPPYHFSESHWRFHYAVLAEGREPDAIHRMMFNHLMEIILCCGPVGAAPKNRKQGHQIALRQFDQKLLWLERNAAAFKNERTRAEIRSIREI